jgi:hypothetical protein
MFKNRFHLATIKPKINTLGNVAFAADDVLFDWTSFEVPKGGCCFRSFNAVMAGTNGTAANGGFKVDLYFAKSIGNLAPPSLGTPNAATTVIKATAARPYINNYHCVNGGEYEDDSDGMVGFNVLGKGTVPGGGVSSPGAHVLMSVMEGSTSWIGDLDSPRGNSTGHKATTPGYQTMWVAGIAQGAYDFGTAVLLNQAGNQAASTVPVDLVFDGTDADDVFAVGDELISFVAANGGTPKVIGKITSIVSATSVVVDAVAEAFADDTEICNLHPIVIKLGLEY